MYSNKNLYLLIIFLYVLGSCSSTPTTISDDIGSSSIRFSVPETSHVKLWVVNSYKTTVAVLVDDVMSAGDYAAHLPLVDQSGKRLPEGMYTYHLKTKNGTVSRAMFFTNNPQ